MYQELTGDDIPAHLRSDAPSVRCPVCHRETVSDFGQRCEMPQPNGERCNGIFPRHPHSINLNEYVWVKLNGLGWQLFSESHKKLKLNPAPYIDILMDQSSHGWQRFQLWVLMEIFGPHLHIGVNNSPFEHNEVRFREPTA